MADLDIMTRETSAKLTEVLASIEQANKDMIKRNERLTELKAITKSMLNEGQRIFLRSGIPIQPMLPKYTNLWRAQLSRQYLIKENTE